MVELSEIKELVNPAVYKALNPERFEQLRKAAFEYIKVWTKIEPVTPRPASLDWLVNPFADIVQYFALQYLPSCAPDLKELSITRYQEARKILMQVKYNPEGVKFAPIFGQIEGLY